MIDAVIKGISIALSTWFGDQYEIHAEEIKQDLEEPCFFIAYLDFTHELFLGRRYFKGNSFCIQYFPETEHVQQECMDVAEGMTECLEVISADGVPIRGTKMKYEVIDSVLHFFVNYDYFAYKKEDSTPMEEISIAQKAQ